MSALQLTQVPSATARLLSRRDETRVFDHTSVAYTRSEHRDASKPVRVLDTFTSSPRIADASSR